MKKFLEIMSGIIWLICFFIQISCIYSLFAQAFGFEHQEIIITFIICEFICYVISNNDEKIPPGLLMYILDFYYRQRKEDEKHKREVEKPYYQKYEKKKRRIKTMCFVW